MSLDVTRAIPIDSGDAFAAWLAAHGASEREVVVGIYKKASGTQTVGFEALLEAAICHGWIDVQTKSIDGERYAIRFVPRRAGSTWSATNRGIAARLLAAGRMTAAGMAALPEELRGGLGS